MNKPCGRGCKLRPAPEEKRNFLKLASAIWPADPVDGWEMTVIMAKELGAIGEYRTPDDNGFVYMVVNNARGVKAGELVAPVSRLQ